MKVSVIVTVKNEGEAIRPLLESLIRQTRPADEVVICDGGSTDGTLAILAEYQTGRLPLRVIVAPGSNISEGRNRAIAAAAGPIIAATDAGVVLSPVWLEEIVRPFLEDGGTNGNSWELMGTQESRGRGSTHGRKGTRTGRRERNVRVFFCP